MSEVDKIMYLGPQRLLLWAETNGSGYDYKMYPLGSRYDKKYTIPDEIIEHIIKNANSGYPIMVIDGYNIDGMLDNFATKKYPVEKSWGRYPRRYDGKGLDDDIDFSINDFVRHQGEERLRKKFEKKEKHCQCESEYHLEMYECKVCNKCCFGDLLYQGNYQTYEEKGTCLDCVLKENEK